MARLDPGESYETLKERVKTAITDSFPYEGNKHILRLKDVEVTDKLDIRDVRSQKTAKMGGRTWGVPVHATMELVDKKTGKVVDTQRKKVATLPKITRRYSYIVDGSEYQVDNLWLLKPGVYTRIKQNGELETQFNVKGGGFHVKFDPEKRKFAIRHGGANPPLYPVMKALGVDDDTLQRSWGKAIFDANKTSTPKKQAIAFAQRLRPHSEIDDYEQAAAIIKEDFAKSELRPEVTKRTLGKPFDKIDKDVMIRATGRLLGVSRGEEKPDDRDSIMFKDLKSTEDFVGDRIIEQSRIITRKVGNNLDRRSKINDIVGPDLFNRPVRTFFTKSSLSSTPEQTNPLAMISAQQKTTIMGDEGGVKSAHRVIEDAKLVNPSHLGVLDPIHTPEGEKTGVTLHMALGASKRGNEVTMPLYNLKTGKIERVDTARAFDATVVMADEVKWKGGKPTATGKVKASQAGNRIGEVSLGKADYVMTSPAQTFSVPINLVPFIANNSQNRATMSGRHQEQAVSLKYREAPLVQAAAGTGTSFDEVVGKFVAQDSPIAGEVVKIQKDGIVIKDEKGKRHNIAIYDDYPLNEKKGVLNSEPTVKVGDKVKPGQIIADTNFTKNGTYAPGVNLNVAYAAARGHNVEDGIVISETGSTKLTSEHMYKKKLSTREGQLEGLKKYQAYYPDRMTKDQAGKLDDTGVIQVGQTVEPGDTVIAALSKAQLTTEDQKLRLIHKSLVKPYRDKAVTWQEEHPGKVVAVSRRGKGITVHVKTDEPAVVGDKIVGRHANKGIITAVLPDHEMPKTKSGRPIDVMLNPMGVPGRMNVGQILETAVSKVAEKTNKPYKVRNFSLKDARTTVEEELKKNGLTDTETIIDPKTGKEIPKVLVGKQYMLKLQHQVDKKMSVRSRDAYDRNLVPKGGLPHGGQSMGQLELYAMLAHGAKHNIREMATLKSDKAQGGDSDELWTALQAGELLPPPKTTFAYNKFISYMKGLGIDINKDGNSLIMSPMTDKQVLAMSSGEIKDGGRMVKMKTMEEEKGGLFDPTVTGGHSGKRWSHMTLKEPMPNPIFEKAIMSVSGIRRPQFERILSGEEGVTKDGEIVGADVKGAQYGPSALGRLLNNVDVGKELKAEEARIGKLKGQSLNETNRRIKYLRALKKLDTKPSEAYMMKHVPVLPPVMRPLSVMDDGSIQFEDINQVYKHISLTNKKLGEMSKYAPDEEKSQLRTELYDELKGLAGAGGSLNRQYTGILDVIAGGSPKTGFFQDKLVKRRQDLSMRSTIVPEPSLGIDQAGIPRKAAMELYKPFVVRELRQSAGMTPLQAQIAIKENREIANKALERVSDERPLIMKRDPVLHKYGVQAFKPKLVEGKAIKIHPLVCAGFNADFDGDTMSAFVPITKEAVEEARTMHPSNMIFSPASGKAQYTPFHEMQVGLYSLSEVGKKTNKRYADVASLKKAVGKGEVGITDVVKVGSKQTTLGRLQIDEIMPKNMRGGKIVSDLSYRFTKKEQGSVFQKMAKNDVKSFAGRMDRMKNLGNERAFTSGFSVGLEDFKVHKDIRDPVLRAAAAKTRNLDLNNPEHAKKYVKAYEDALIKIESGVKDRANKRRKTNLDKLEVAAGIKGNGYRQLTAAPVLFTDAKGDVVDTPVRRSYSEGLSVADYWASTSGGRKGILQRTQSTAEPGYLSKQMMNSTMNTLIHGDDCGTTRGVSLSVDEPDIIGRYTQADIKLTKNRSIPKGTIITPEVLSSVRNRKITKVVVRSPMKCNHAKGICPKCFGLNENGQMHDEGTNIGVLSAQSLGERGTQLSMKAFHCFSNDSSVLALVGDQEVDPELITLEKLYTMFEDRQVDSDGTEEVIHLDDGDLRVWDGDWVSVEAIRRHKPDHPMVTVQGGPGILMSQDNHATAVHGVNGRVEFKAPSDMDEHTELFADLSWCHSYGDEENDLDLNPYFVGMYVAEGWIGYRWTNPKNRVEKPYSIGMKQNPGPIRDKLLASIPTEWNPKEVGKSTIEVHRLKVGRRFEHLFGRYSRNVSLPSEFIHYSDEWLATFLCGLIDGDGTVTGDHRRRYAHVDSTSFELIQQLCVIGTRLGAKFSTTTTPVRKLTRNQGFRFTIWLTNSVKDRLSESLKVSASSCGPDETPTDNVGFVPLNKIKLAYYDRKFVYDLTTESGQLVVGGLLSHNSGGVHQPGTKSLADVGLVRAQELLNMPQKLKGSATLATVNGKISSIQKDPAGGYNVMVGDARHYIPANRKMMSSVRVGVQVKKGAPLTHGPVNPHELLPLAGVHKTQNYLADELHKVYAKEGIRRRHSEVVVKSLSNVTKVTDPGDHPDYIRGDFANTSQVQHVNRTLLKGGKPIKHSPILRGVKQIPLDVQEDWLARLNHEELKSTVIEGAQRGWQSNLHGAHPIPPLVYGAEFGKGSEEEPYGY